MYITGREGLRGIYLITILLFIMVLFTVIFPSATGFVVNAQQPQVYAYSVNLGNISIEHVIVINDHEIAVIGSAKGTSLLAVYEVSDPISGVKQVMVYPIVGRVTAVATNGYPVERIAIGTDKGEILLFAVNGGKLYKLLQYIGGVDFYVKKIIVLTGKGNSYKVAALVSEGGRPSGVCLTCQVYVFDELSKSVFRVGATVGNASASSFHKVYPQLIAAPLVVEPGKYYYDASHLFVAWLPYTEFVHLLLNVTYVTSSEKSAIPASKAAVEVVVFNRSTGTKYVYGLNADSRGIADIIVPRGFDVNVTVFDIYGVKYHASFNLSKMPSYVRVIHEQLVLRAPPLTTPMAEIYGQPSFTKYIVGVLDVSTAPTNYKLVKVLDYKLPRGTLSMRVVRHSNKYGSWYLLVFVDPLSGNLNLLRISNNFDVTNGSVTDYVGRSRSVASVITFPNSPYVAVGLDDGTIKAYEWMGTSYMYVNEYVSPAKLVSMKPVPMAGKNVYVVYTSNGLQVISIGVSQFPYLRINTRLSFAPLHVVSGDASASLTLIAVGGGSSLVVAKGLNNVVFGRVPVDISKYLLPSLTIRIIPPNKEKLTNGRLVFSYPNGKIVYNLSETKNYEVVVPRVIPGETYAISIMSSNPHLQNVTKLVTIPTFGKYIVSIPIPYRKFSVNVKLMDTLTGKIPNGNFTAIIDGKMKVPVVNGSLRMQLVYGNHTISIVPQGIYAKIYRPSNLLLNVNRSTSVVISMSRIMYRVKIMLLDDVTESAPITPLMVYVNGSTTQILKPGNEEFTLYLRSANYTISIKPARGFEKVYNNVSLRVDLTRNYEDTLQIPRKTYVVNISVRDITTGKLEGKFALIVNNTQVLTNIRAEANVTLPYGKYVFQLKPLPKYEKMYMESKPKTIKVENNTKVSFNMRRMYYSLSVSVYDDLGNPVKNAKISVINTDMGSLLTQMYTDQNGMASTSLFYGHYKIIVDAKGFYQAVQQFTLDSSKNIRITLQPQILTVVFRYLPIIAIAAIAGVAVIIIAKLKAILAERLASSEEIF